MMSSMQAISKRDFASDFVAWLVMLLAVTFAMTFMGIEPAHGIATIALWASIRAGGFDK